MCWMRLIRSRDVSLGRDKAISSGKCKIKWTKTTMPSELGGLGVLDLNKFVATLRLRWLWQEWSTPDKAWIGMEVPCTENDRQLFMRCTTITLGNGNKAAFWNSGWLNGQRPKDISSLLYNKTRHKKQSVADALRDNKWIIDLNHRSGFTTAHLLQFSVLWNLVTPTELSPQREDTISWNLTRDGNYSTTSAYKAQFVGYVKTPDLASIQKTWAPPKCKFSAWLLLQNRVWTSNKLARRECDHNPTCPLCHTTMETAHHLVAECHYMRRVWVLVANWTGQRYLHPDEWPHNESVLHWWSSLTTAPDISRKQHAPSPCWLSFGSKGTTESLITINRRYRPSWPWSRVKHRHG
jgi:hypothetical protein